MRCIDVVLVGAGDRADVYAGLSLKKPEKMRVVGIVEPNEVRMALMKEKYNVLEENCFSNLQEFVKREKFADAVINGTMDQIHVQTSIPVLEKGYDLLLEKPFCVNEKELWELKEAADLYGSRVFVCHVLRYAPFYAAIKRHLLSGEIGEIKSIQLEEHVAHHHMGVSYLRGKWANEKECGAPFLLAKSCHDIDLMMWMTGSKPKLVASFGSDYQFRPEKKPVGAGHHCMLDCPAVIEEQCMYSARRNYLEPEIRWTQYVYKCLEGQELTYENCKQSLMNTDNNYAKCVWDCEHDIVDHQSVIVNFEDGAVGTFSLVGGAAKPERKIHIIGTLGEIKGVFEESCYEVRTIKNGIVLDVKTCDLNITGGMDGEHGEHGGGDLRLAEDFVDSINGMPLSISCTSLDDSIASHLTVFKAEEARKKGMVVKVF